MSKELTPRRIVVALDEHIVGQSDAKRAVAVAIRNRWRRRQLDPEIAREVYPKNILMIGPTGVGKTEIARRLAALVEAPFVKVEASKYTEVGYHGRDVESMVRDLAETAIGMIRTEHLDRVRARAREVAEDRVLDLLLPIEKRDDEEPEAKERHARTREKLRGRLRAGELDAREVEITIQDKPVTVGMGIGPAGMEELGVDFQQLIERMVPGRTVRRRATVAEAMRLLGDQEAENLIDREAIAREGIERAENDGIVFLDEMDKIAGRERGSGPDVSREGVQRDLLPVVEGTTVQTRHGPVRTDHVLFIAAGAFHVSKPSDLIPELQGRFPIRVELSDLAKEDYIRILTEPKGSLVRQYEALLGTEGVALTFAPEAIDGIAEIAVAVNRATENIGARRLQTVMEKLLEEISFEAGDSVRGKVAIDAATVRERLDDIAGDTDLSRYVL